MSGPGGPAVLGVPGSESEVAVAPGAPPHVEACHRNPALAPDGAPALGRAGTRHRGSDASARSPKFNFSGF